MLAGGGALGASDARAPSVELAEHPHYLVAAAVATRPADDYHWQFRIEEMVLGSWDAGAVSLRLDPATSERVVPGARYLITFSNVRKVRLPASKELVATEPYLARLNVAGEGIVGDTPLARDLLLGEMGRKAGAPKAYAVELTRALETSDLHLQRMVAGELYGHRAVREVAAEALGQRLHSFVVNSHVDPVARRLVLGTGEGPVPAPWAIAAATQLLRATPSQPAPDGYLATLVIASLELLGRMEESPATELIAPWLVCRQRGVAEAALTTIWHGDVEAGQQAVARALEQPFVPAAVRAALQQRINADIAQVPRPGGEQP